MKRIFLTMIAAAFLVSAASYAQISFGVRAGLNLQNLNGKDNAGDKLENKLIPGFHAGVNVEFPIAQDFYLQPGLQFSTKGARNKSNQISVTDKLGYLELPIHLVYKPQLGTGKLILGFGPYLAYGITGKEKADYNGTTNDIDIKFKSKLSDTEHADANTRYVKGFDAGADIFFGYEFAFKVSVQINAQLGMLNLYPGYPGDENDKSVVKNTGFGLSLGYRF